MNIFTLTGEVLLKDAGVNNKLDTIDKKAGQTSKNMSSHFTSMAKAALKFGAVLGVGLGIKDMVTKATAAQKKMAQMDAVLKSTSGVAGMTKEALLKLADAQSKVTTFSKGTTMAGESLLLTFTGIGKKVFPDTMKAAQDMSTAMGTDLNSSVMTLGKALNSPADGLAKLQKQGVTFTKAQKDQVKAMVKVGNTAGAQKIMLAELHKEFGGSAEAAGKTFGGQLTILKNKIGGVSSSLGMTLMPYMTKFMTFINSNMPKIQAVITGVIGAIVPKFQQWMKLIVTIVKELLPNFGKSASGLKGNIDILGIGMSAITSILTFMAKNINIVKAALILYGSAMLISAGLTIKNNIQLGIQNGLRVIAAIKDKAETAQIWLMIAAEKAHAIAVKAGAVAQKIFNVAMEANPIIKIIALILLLGAGLAYLFNHNKTFHDFVVKSWIVIKQTVGDSITAVVGFFKGLATTVSDVWTSIKTTTETILKPIATFISETIGQVVNFVKSNLPQMKEIFNTVFNGIKTVIDVTFKIISTYIKIQIKAWQIVISAALYIIKAVFSTVWNAISTVFRVVFGVIKTIVTVGFNGIKAIITAALGIIKAVITTVLNVIKGVFSAVWNSIVTIVRTVFNVIKEVVTTAIHVVENVIKLVMDLITGHWKNAWNDMVNICKSLFSGIKSVVSTILSGVGKLFTDFVKTAIGYGSGIIKGIISGIKGEAAKLAKGIGDIITDVKNAFLKGFGIASPSKYFTWIGGHLMGGLLKGMKGAQVKKFAMNMVGSIKGAFSGLSGSLGGSLSGILTTAMTMTGTPLSELPMLQALIQHESGGNPSAINLTDSNAKAGHPSQGLMQMIPATFARWMMPGFSGITNPLSNVLAGLRYIKGTYGSLSNVPGIKSMAGGGAYKGYAVGSRYVPADITTTVHKGEMIVPKSENPYANSGNGKTLPLGDGITLNIENFINNTKEDIEEIATELAAYLKMKKVSVGGK